MTLAANVSLKQATVAQLVRAAQAGNREAFGELVVRFEHAVFATALRRLRNYSEAQELCQDVFIQAFEKLDQLRVPDCFAGWLRSIAKRMTINRAVRRPPVVTTEPETLAGRCVERRTPLTDALRAERQGQVRAGLSRLRDLDRQTLEAFYVRGRSLIEMSNEFGAPVGTIKRRLHVARKRLAKQFEETAV
jgi:RNA polymerase sigma-70 factor (ECF subfamily)